MKINEAYKSFLAHGRGERNYARETLVKLQDCFRAWILPVLGEIEVEGLSRMDIAGLRNAMRDRGLGAYRQYSVVMALKVFCRFCRQVLRLNCIDPDKEIPLPQRPKPFVEFLTNAEVEWLRGAIDVNKFAGLRMRTLIEVLLTTGLRISEALSLDRGPFEAGETEVDIVGKGGKRRTIFVPEATVAWIKRFLRLRADDFPAIFVTTGVPRRLDRNDLSRYFKELKWKAGIDKKLTPHILRHTYCTNLRDNGTDITLIKELAGHQDIQTTAKYYLGVSRQSLRDAVRRNLRYETENPTATAAEGLAT
jgi:integrase/recombinase XerD